MRRIPESKRGRKRATQVKHPWRATFRTVFALVVGLASSWAVLVQALNLDPTWQWVTVGGAVAAAITRAMASPVVDQFLHNYFPWLSATPSGK